MEKVNTDIAIIGCGFGGMITALSLAYLGIEVTLFEESDTTVQKIDIRTTALNDKSKDFLDTIGLWKDIEQFVCPIANIYVLDNKSVNMLHFPSAVDKDDSNGSGVLGYVIKNIDFRRILLSKIRTNKFITLFDKCSYESIVSANDHCIISLQNSKLYICNLCIICDGHNSRAKKRYFSYKVNKKYGQCALTFLIQHQLPHEKVAIEHFMPDGPFATLPLSDQYTSSVVWTISEQKSRVLMNLPKAEFNEILQQNCDAFLQKINLISDIQCFTLKGYLTNQYFFKRIALVADSAHVIHPLAGQGLNQGIKDIHALSDLINECNTIDNRTYEAILTQYQKLRQSDNEDMYTITDTINFLFSNNSSILKFIRRGSLFTAMNINALKYSLIKYAMGYRF